MSDKTTQSAIVSVIKSMAHLPLFIEKHQAQALVMRYDSMRQSGAFDGIVSSKENPIQVQFYNASTNIAYGKFAADFTKIEKGSIAVVPVMGAMMRDSYCTMSDGFVSGTRDLEATVKALDQNENVDGIVFYINSPGGQADGNESLSRVIASTKTPTVGFFEGMASAAVYAFEGVNELYAAETQSYWGSIGTYITIADDRAFWESMGVNYLEIYAPQSTEKNIEVNEALDGNLEPMKQLLSSLTDSFIKSVKKSRPQLQDDGHVFKGKLYSATDAMKIGAIDGIKNLEYAIERARILGKKAKKQNSNTNQTTDIMSIENEKKLSFFEKIFGASTATEAEADLQNVQNSTKELQSKFDELQKKFANVSELNATATAEIEKLNEQLNQSALLAETNEAKVIEMAATLTAQSELLQSKGFETLEAALQELETVFAHNKELGGVKAAETPINNQQTVENTVVSTKKTYDQIEAEAAAALDAKRKKSK